jgi:hypothetical protein
LSSSLGFNLHSHAVSLVLDDFNESHRAYFLINKKRRK